MSSVSPSEYSKHDYTDGDLIDETFSRLWDAGERDGLNGGVHPSIVAEEVPYTRKTVVKHLEKSEEYCRVQGLSPDLQPRTSFAPVGGDQ